MGPRQWQFGLSLTLLAAAFVLVLVTIEQDGRPTPALVGAASISYGAGALLAALHLRSRARARRSEELSKRLRQLLMAAEDAAETAELYMTALEDEQLRDSGVVVKRLDRAVERTDWALTELSGLPPEALTEATWAQIERLRRVATRLRVSLDLHVARAAQRRVPRENHDSAIEDA